MTTRWLVQPRRDNLEQALSRALRTSRLLARLLVNRGVDSITSAQAFLYSGLSDLEEPERIPGMTEAVARLALAVERGERVFIFGDYDVDGLCSTAVLARLLRPLGMEPRYYVPHRIEEGYGLNRAALESIAERGADLLVTVDCGMDAWLYEEVLRRAPYDLLVVDHHEPHHPITAATAVVNPKLAGEEVTFPDLAGVGVTFKLAWALARRLTPEGLGQQQMTDLFTELAALAALGTVADVVPLLGENRILTRLGLQALQHSRLPGLQALLKEAGLTGRDLRAEDIAFRLGPRLNAAGRMGEAELALELLTTDSPEQAGDTSTRLEQHNRVRRQLQDTIEREALEQLAAADLADRRVLLVGQEGWSPGVIGIVAGRLADRFYRPAAVVAIDGERARGSARSVPGFHVLQALRGCQDCLLEFGGHAQAAGFTLRSDRIDELRERLEALTGDLPEGLWQPSLSVDAEVVLGQLNVAVVRELERLEPLGEGNPPPVLASHDVEVAGEVRRLGREGKHLSFYANQGGSALRVIAFGMGERAAELTQIRHGCSLAYTPKLSTFRRSEPEVELHLKDFQPSPGEG